MAAESSPGRMQDESATRFRVAVVADDPKDRESLSAAFAGHQTHRVLASTPLELAAEALGQHSIDVIVGFVEDEGAWRRFRRLASHFADTLSILLASDPDSIGATAEAPALDAVLPMDREEIPGRAAGIATRLLTEFHVEGTSAKRVKQLEHEMLESLSDREIEVLVLTAHGLAIKEIALQLHRTYATVATHRANIMEKLGLHDKVALTRFAIRTGLVEA